MVKKTLKLIFSGKIEQSGAEYTPEKFQVVSNSLVGHYGGSAEIQNIDQNVNSQEFTHELSSWNKESVDY